MTAHLTSQLTLEIPVAVDAVLPLVALLIVTMLLSRDWGVALRRRAALKEQHKAAVNKLTIAKTADFCWKDLNDERKYIEGIGNTRLGFLLIFVGLIAASLAADLSKPYKTGILTFASFAAIVLSLAIFRAFQRAHSLRVRLIQLMPSGECENPFFASDDKLLFRNYSFHRLTSTWLPAAVCGCLIVVLVAQFAEPVVNDDKSPKIKDVNSAVQQIAVPLRKLDSNTKSIDVDTKSISDQLKILSGYVKQLKK